MPWDGTQRDDGRSAILLFSQSPFDVTGRSFLASTRARSVTFHPSRSNAMMLSVGSDIIFISFLSDSRTEGLSVFCAGGEGPKAKLPFWEVLPISRL